MNYQNTHGHSYWNGCPSANILNVLLSPKFKSSLSAYASVTPIWLLLESNQ